MLSHRPSSSSHFRVIQHKYGLEVRGLRPSLPPLLSAYIYLSGGLCPVCIACVPVSVSMPTCVCQHLLGCLPAVYSLACVPMNKGCVISHSSSKSLQPPSLPRSSSFPGIRVGTSHHQMPCSTLEMVLWTFDSYRMNENHKSGHSPPPPSTLTEHQVTAKPGKQYYGFQVLSDDIPSLGLVVCWYVWKAFTCIYMVASILDQDYKLAMSSYQGI